MTRRNLILLIIIVVTGMVWVIWSWFFQKTPASPDEGNSGFNFISQFNPFGESSTKAPPTSPYNISEDQSEPAEETSVKLQKISDLKVAGFGLFIKERFKEIAETGEIPQSAENPAEPTPPATEKALALRYVERETGNIFQTFADKIEERKFSSTLVPKVYESFWGNKGETVVMRYLKSDGKTRETFIGNLPKEYLGGDMTEDNEIKGSFLPEGITNTSLSPDSGSLFYLFNVGDGTVGTIVNLATGKKSQVFDSPFTEWLSFWPNSKTITLTTKPSSFVPGYMYTLNLVSKMLNKTLGDINGLTTLAGPDGKLVLYSDNGLSLALYHTDTKISDSLNLRTSTEKCAWAGSGNILYCAVPRSIGSAQYPDAWYQGEISFSDQFWKIDIKTKTAELLIDPVENGAGEIDAFSLTSDADENYLFFLNKKDSSLWRLGLK